MKDAVSDMLAYVEVAWHATSTGWGFVEGEEGLGLGLGVLGQLTCELSTKSMWRMPQPNSTLATAHPSVPTKGQSR